VYVFAAGYRQVSLIDVMGEPSFVVWFCGCNLKCPFCHNYRIADGTSPQCRRRPVTEIVEAMKYATPVVEYVQTTGGEPLLQPEAVIEIFHAAVRMGLRTSLDSNLTLTKNLEYVLDSTPVHHIATDVKAPPEVMYGLPEDRARQLWRDYIRSLEILAERFTGTLELRILVPPRPLPAANRYISEVREVVKRMRARVVWRQIKLRGPPHVEVRNPLFFRVAGENKV